MDTSSEFPIHSLAEQCGPDTRSVTEYPLDNFAKQPGPDMISVTGVFVAHSASQSLLTEIPTCRPLSKALPPLRSRLHPQSPMSAMVLCFLLGILLAVSHHLFYQHLNGTVVKTKDHQEWALRLGNGLALATKAVLIAAVGIAFTQHIWTIFRQKAITVKGIDAIFAAPNDVFAFLNREMWLKGFVGTVIAGLLWILPIVITVLPPTSLSVHAALLPNLTIQSQVPVPIYNNETYAELSNTLTYKGSRISRLIFASATNVAIIPMKPPYPSISYTVDFYGPSFNCTLEWFNRSQANNANVIEIYNFSNTTSNVLSFWTQINDKYIQCALYNTSFHTVFSFADNIQSTTNNRTFINAVKYPGSTTDTRDIPYSLSYQGWMDPISDMLRGYLYKNEAVDAVGWFSDIGLTGLIYSSDIRPALSDQIPDDPSIGATQLFIPLEDLLEEFSVNMTMSLFSSSLLSPSKYTTNITIKSSINIYAYNRATLLFPYLASIVCAAFAIAIGARAFGISGKSQSTSFSSIVCTTRNKELDDLLANDTLGAKPLKRSIAKTRLRFAPSEGRGRVHWAFRVK